MWYAKDARTVVRELGSDGERGLSREEAARRLAEYGKNIIDDGKRSPGFFRKLLLQLADFMVVLLLAAAVVSFLVSRLQGEADYLDSLIILAIVIVNAVLGVVQENKAEKAIAALQALSAPTARVIREGKVQTIPATQVVPGDILEIETGDYIPADVRLLSVFSLKSAEAALTGESAPVEKEANLRLEAQAPVGDRKNMVFASSYIVYGRGRGIVVATGMDTEMGKIAGLMTEFPREETPLQRRLAETGKTLGAGALAICAGIFLIGIFRQIPPFQMFMTAISLAVAAIPEGLTAIVTIVLAMGMRRMSRQNAVVRRLTAVETLGGAQVICSDKTGTLTQNKMQVAAMADAKNRVLEDPAQRRFLLKLAALCNDAREEGGSVVGEPTEAALVEAALAEGLSRTALEKEYPRVGEIPFSSERKRMDTIHQHKNGYLFVMKGAPEVVLERCSRVLQDGRPVFLTEGLRRQALSLCADLAADALRVLALAYQEATSSRHAEGEQDLILAGFFGLWDPPRPEAADSVALCRRAGIRPVMVTGDHVLTARAIAGRLGIYRPGDGCIDGVVLESMDDKTLSAACRTAAVFARVSPAHKVRIVRAFQGLNQVVAMTGDGVNDAPALRAADIGCAMGKNGTDVAKAAADMILTDDNFATIVAAVREGRGIYSNIRKAVHFLLSSNIGEILTIFLAMCFGWATPLLPIQLLWVNLVTDSLPAIALGLEPTPEDIMDRPPVPKNAGVFSDGLGARIALEGVMIGMLTLLAFGIGHLVFDKGNGVLTGRTMAFAVLSVSQLVHAFNMRSDKSLFTLNPLGNPFLLLALAVGLILQLMVIMVPTVAAVFGTVPLGLKPCLVVAGLSLLPLLVVELEKIFSPMK